MEIKTLEEYALNKIETLENEVETLTKENEAIKEQDDNLIKILTAIRNSLHLHADKKTVTMDVWKSENLVGNLLTFENMVEVLQLDGKDDVTNES